jgi:hypothetical protein
MSKHYLPPWQKQIPGHKERLSYNLFAPTKYKFKPKEFYIETVQNDTLQFTPLQNFGNNGLGNKDVSTAKSYNIISQGVFSGQKKNQRFYTPQSGAMPSESKSIELQTDSVPGSGESVVFANGVPDGIYNTATDQLTSISEAGDATQLEDDLSVAYTPAGAPLQDQLTAVLNKNANRFLPSDSGYGGSSNISEASTLVESGQMTDWKVPKGYTAFDAKDAKGSFANSYPLHTNLIDVNDRISTYKIVKDGKGKKIIQIGKYNYNK